jgi:lipopolysaccharide transport system ATP-binding protein
MQDTADPSFAIQVTDIGKCYHIYAQPLDRLKQSLFRGRRQFYQEFWALRNVSFQLNAGDTLGVIGRNGSGKSTLLQLICGTLTPTQGSVQTKGRVAALLELGSGFNPEFTGIENVNLNGTLLGLSKEEINDRLEDILAFADIGEFVYQPVKTYSSGMVVRLAFGVIAHADPDILVVDEALAVGDAVFTRKCMRFIENLRQEKTILFVSHDPASVASLCDQCLWLDKGKVVMKSETRRVLESYRKACHAEFQEIDFSFYTDEQQAPDVSIPGPAAETPAAKAMLNESVERVLHPALRGSKPTFAEGLPRQLRHNVVASPHAAQQFGDGAVLIESTSLVYRDKPDEAVLMIKGGEQVVLTINACSRRVVSRPCIAGFSVSNEKGMEFFGENTYIEEDPLAAPCLQPGEWLTVRFVFTMPPLRPGHYFVVVALASGSQADHIQHHYIHEAIQFLSVANLERPIMGMFATDVHDITMTKSRNPEPGQASQGADPGANPPGLAMELSSSHPSLHFEDPCR